MGNYELMFACVARDGAVRPYERVIAVPDHATALKVAYAMVGERVDTDQTLDCMVYVIPTERSAFVPRTPSGYFVLWGHVFRALGVDTRQIRLWFGADIGLGTNPTGHVIPDVAQHGEPEIVGFLPWPTPKEPHE
jgi:hypothetical protein